MMRPHTTLSVHNFWQGELVRLRAVEPEDGEIFQAWNQDSETGRFLDFVWPPGSLAGAREWAQKTALQQVKKEPL